MTKKELAKKIAQDPSYALRLVVVNNAAAVTNAMMADALIQGSVSEQELHDNLLQLYNAGEYRTLEYILSQVPYLVNSELPTGYDELMTGSQSYRFTGPPTQEEWEEGQPNPWEEGQTDNESESGFNWWEALGGPVIDFIGENAGTWFGWASPETNENGAGNGGGPRPDQDDDNTMIYVAIGGVILLAVIVVLATRK